MKKNVFKKLGALALAAVMTLSLVSPCVSYAVEDGCSLPEHQHTDECYNLSSTREFTCPVASHQHSSECYDMDSNLVCGYTDHVVHTHDEYCYDEDGTLVCALPEYQAHVHTADCFVENKVLICEEPASSVPTHEHADACYEEQRKCVCGLEDDESHIHTEECFETERILSCGQDEEVLGHVHTDECYKTEHVAICGEDDQELMSHQHDESCFTEVAGDRSETPLCGKQEHIHSDACQPKVDDKPASDPSFTNPDASSDEPVAEPASVIQYSPVVQRIVSEGDTSSKWYYMYKVSGDEVIMPTSTSVQLSGGEQKSFSPITFSKEGEYVFKIYNNNDVDYYNLTVIVTNDGGILRLAILYTHMPDDVVNGSIAVFSNLSICVTPAVRRIAVGEGTPGAKYFRLSRSSTSSYVTMPSSTVISISGSTMKSYNPIRIYEPGTYEFLIREVSSMSGGTVSGSDPGWNLIVTAAKENDVLRVSYLYQSISDGTESTEYAVFKDFFVQFVPVVRNEFIGTGAESYVFEIKKSTSPSAGISSNRVSVQGEGEARFSPITFSEEGTYEFSIEQISPESYDKRSHKLTVMVTGAGEALSASGTYMVDGETDTTSDCSTFINVEKKRHGWSTTTEAKARRLLNQMTLEEKVGQMFLLHYSDTKVRTAAEIKAITDKYHPGGYIVFQADLANDTPASFKQKIDQTQKDSKIPLLISIDEEGGKVNRASSLSQYRTSPYPGPQDLKAKGGLAAVHVDGIDKADFLENLGINMNHAPVADVATTGYIYARTWGGNGVENADYVATAVSAMQNAGMGTTLKHFPGYGSTSSNTHNGFAVNYLTENDFRYNDLLPFYAGMSAGNRAVMVTHNTINYLDQQNPASLSPAVYNMLRNEMDFDGLAITDDLNMKAVIDYVGDGNQSLAALKAGADMALVPYPDKHIPPVLAAARSGELPMSHIDESCFRILCWKIENGLMNDITDINKSEAVVSIPVKVIVDNVPVQVGEIKKAYLKNDSSGASGYYILLDEIDDALEEYGFEMDRYLGSLVFGTQAASNAGLMFVANSINKVDGTWRLSLPETANLDSVSLFLSSKVMEPGALNVDGATRECGFYTVKVNDVAGSTMDDLENVSSVQYLAAGSSTMLKLPMRKFPLTWTVNKTDISDFTYSITGQGSAVLVTLSQVYSPVVVSSGQMKNVEYTVQYYANLNVLDKSGQGAAANSLDIIDTSGGVLPQNKVEPKIMKLTLNDDGTIKKTNELKKIYLDEVFSYQNASTITQIDKVLTFDAHYAPQELWVLKEGKDPQSTDRADWEIYNKDDFGIDSLYELKMTNIAESSSSPTTILLSDNSIIRIVYEPITGTAETSADFWDYDITDGFIYSTTNFSSTYRKNTSAQTNSDKAYANTIRQGINNPVNYPGFGAKFAFGNANTNTELEKQTIDSMYFNQFNRVNGVAQGYKGCFFGLATGLDSKGNVVFNSGLDVPDLFGETGVTGKTPISGHTLQFSRDGDTYTLEAVGGTDTKALSSFRHPGIYDGVQHKTVLWSNDFWPMDSAKTFGADGHDLRFGNSTLKQNRAYGAGSYQTMPVSDDGLDHNSYFGMHFAVDFAIPKGYCGDLEYCFFGDDDIWMFLDGKLVLDIGGCHSSVGEYVNLWDYIPQGDTSPHQLQFYYLERGASGSSCWIQYTIPSAKIVGGNVEEEGELKVGKTLVGNEDDNQQFDFTFQLMDENGKLLYRNIPCLIYDKSGIAVDTRIINSGEGQFSLYDGEFVIFYQLPSGTTYRIVEDEYDCDTYALPGEIELPRIPGSDSGEEPGYGGEEIDPGESGGDEAAESGEEAGEEGEEEVEIAGDGEIGEDVSGTEVGSTSTTVGGIDMSFFNDKNPSREISGTISGNAQTAVSFINVFTSGSELPETGGPGVSTLEFTGTVILVVSAAILWNRKKQLLLDPARRK